jgi:hypothetical protein
MADNILRISSVTQTTLTLTNSTATTGSFSMAGKAGALLHCVSTSTNGNVTVQFHSMPDERDGGSFALCDSANNLLALTMAPNRCYALPDELFAALKVLPVLTSNAQAQVRVSFKT